MPHAPYHVDFVALALQSPSFAPFLKLNGQVDFANPAAVRQLTISLLSCDFGLSVELPEDRLCPPVPSRLNYVHWIQDLIDQTVPEPTADDHIDATAHSIIGLDIGTGASAIYPLLACAERRAWRFVATDIDDKNLTCAHANVARNKLDRRIHVLDVAEDESLVPMERITAELGFQSLDFVMCNPPFYESTADLKASAVAKARPPFSSCTGASVEMVTLGGESAFVSRIISESVALGDRVHWFSSLLGKLSSVAPIVERLRAVGCVNWAVTEFGGGSGGKDAKGKGEGTEGQGRTRRWAVAWSWRRRRPDSEIARQITSPSFPRHLLPFPANFTFTPGSALQTQTPQPKSHEVHLQHTAPSYYPSAIVDRINSTLDSLELTWNWNQSSCSGIGFSVGNVWSRQARRQRRFHREQRDDGREQERTDDTGEHEGPKQEPLDADSAALVFRIAVVVPVGCPTEVRVRWLAGEDSVLFESFCGMVKRAVG